MEVDLHQNSLTNLGDIKYTSSLGLFSVTRSDDGLVFL